MNKKGQRSTIGFVLLMVLFVYVLVLFSTIEPFKESLDEVRGDPNLNCPGTPNFNSTAYADDETNELNKLVRRPTCFITGISMIYFIGSFLLAASVWVVGNWRRTK